MNDYEAIFIMKSDLEAEAKKATVESISAIITKHGGTVKELNELGKKRLAYKVKKFSDGENVLVNFQAPAESIAKAKKEYALDENILRVMIVRP